jgi:predicted dehydrogenase
LAGAWGIGIIGSGGMGTHLANMCLRAPGTKIAAAYDAVEGQARSLATQLKCDTCTKIEELLGRSDIDAVIIATPNYTHREYSVAALRAGKHVFCEKPMALKLEDCDSMIAAAERAGLALMIGHVMRFYPGCSSAKRAIADGEIGRPIACDVFRTGWVEVGSWAQSWRHSKELCDNSLFESTIHEIDLMRWFMGDVESVQGYGSNFLHPELDYDDCTIASLRFKSGALGTLASGYAFRLGDHRMRVNGAMGAAHIDFDASTVSIVTKEKPKRTAPLMSDVDPYAAELGHFMDCLSHGKRPFTGGLEGRGAVEIATAINRSAQSGRRVDLPLEQ